MVHLMSLARMDGDVFACRMTPPVDRPGKPVCQIVIERGRRPSFDNAEEPERARAMFDLFVAELGATGIPVQTGRFREMMIVALENDGPVTFVYDV